jgi:hypothetical protein
LPLYWLEPCRMPPTFPRVSLGLNLASILPLY